MKHFNVIDIISLALIESKHGNWAMNNMKGNVM